MKGRTYVMQTKKDEDHFILRTSKDDTLWVEGLTDDTVHVIPMGGEILDEFAEKVIGCFHPQSNFFHIIKELYGRTGNVIAFRFNEVPISVTEETDIDTILSTYKEMSKIIERRKYKEWLRSEERKEYLKAEREEKRTRKAVEQLLRNEPDIELKNPEYFLEVKNSKSDRTAAIVRYAERWGRLMQYHLRNGKSLADVVLETRLQAATFEDLTGSMLDDGLCLLVDCWKHGEDLREAWNEAQGYPGASGVAMTSVLLGGKS